MGVFHYRKNHKRYKTLPPFKECTYCEDDMDGRSVRQTEYFYIVPNRVFYDVWELREVTDHMLIIPKKHVENVAELEPAAQLELIKMFGEYTDKGYHVYTRGINNQSRTVRHQHTHLIKTKQKIARAQIAISKPHILVKL